MKKLAVIVNRVYTTSIELKFPNDGRDHIQEIEERLANKVGMLWDLVYEKELEQMNITNESWEISEIHQTRTGALSPDAGPRN
jgi:hypothetical protein